MIMAILGFILPMLLWVLMFPLKVLMKLLIKGLEKGGKKLVEAYQRVDSNSKKGKALKNITRTYKVAKFLSKWGYRTAKFTIKSTIKLVKFLIRLVTILIDVISWVLAFISLGYAILIFGLITALIATIIVVIDIDENSSKNTPQNNTQQGGGSIMFNGQLDNYMKLDWGQDFTKQLDKIEKEYSLETRNWVELTIVSMNTTKKALENGEINTYAVGYHTGIKAIETEQTSLLGSARGVTSNRAYYTANPRLPTPMQFDMTLWGALSPYYNGVTGRPSTGDPHYYPDAFYGMALNFNKYANKEAVKDRTDAIYKEAFELMGMTPTDQQMRYLKFVNTFSTMYNAVFLENSSYNSFGLTRESANDTVLVNSLLDIQFFNMYGWGSSDKLSNFSRKLYEHINGDTEYKKHILSKHSTIKALYGYEGGNQHGYPDTLPKEANLGVTDTEGNYIKGPLIVYLADNMPDKARDKVYNSSGFKTYNSANSHYMRARYDLTVLVTGEYDVWWASNALGLSSSSTTTQSSSSSEEVEED